MPPLTRGAAGIGPAPGGVGSIQLTIEIPGLDTLDVRLSRFGEDVADWEDFWREDFAPQFYQDIAAGFASHGATVPGGWAPLSPRYAAWKRRRFPGQPIMRRTDALVRSLTWVSRRPGKGGVFRPRATELEIGTAISYARYHQTGAGRNKKRPVVFVPAGAAVRYGRLLHTWLMRRAHRAGLSTAARVA